MQNPEQFKKKDTKIRRLMESLEGKYAYLLRKVRAGEATEDEEKELQRLKSQLKTANNAG